MATVARPTALSGSPIQASGLTSELLHLGNLAEHREQGADGGLRLDFPAEQVLEEAAGHNVGRKVDVEQRQADQPGGVEHPVVVDQVAAAVHGRHPLGHRGAGDRLGDALLGHLLDLPPHDRGELDAGPAVADRVVGDHHVEPGLLRVEQLADLEVDPEKRPLEPRSPAMWTPESEGTSSSPAWARATAMISAVSIPAERNGSGRGFLRISLPAGRRPSLAGRHPAARPAAARAGTAARLRGRRRAQLGGRPRGRPATLAATPAAARRGVGRSRS